MSNNRQGRIHVPGQQTADPRVDPLVQSAMANVAAAKELFESLYLAAFSGCVAADFARGMAIEDEKRRRDPSITGPMKVELQLELVAGAARAYVQAGLALLTGAKQGAQVRPQEPVQAKAG